MALKMSGAYKQCKPCPGPTTYRKRPFPEFDTISEGLPYPYLQTGSSSSTPAWDFGKLRHHPGGDRSVSQSGEVVIEEDQSKEWIAQVEPGVQITFTSLPNGGNDLKRIRFSRETFNKWQAQRWWGENYDRIMELYNVQKFNRQSLQTPPRLEDERISSYSRGESARQSLMTSVNKQWTPGPNNDGPSTYGPGGPRVERPSVDTTTSSRDEASVSISNASEVEAEWIEEDEPGVYITIRQLLDGTRELRRVRFNRERFGESRAKIWWEENRERIQDQYL